MQRAKRDSASAMSSDEFLIQYTDNVLQIRNRLKIVTGGELSVKQRVKAIWGVNSSQCAFGNILAIGPYPELLRLKSSKERALQNTPKKAIQVNDKRPQLAPRHFLQPQVHLNRLNAHVRTSRVEQNRDERVTTEAQVHQQATPRARVLPSLDASSDQLLPEKRQDYQTVPRIERIMQQLQTSASSTDLEMAISDFETSFEHPIIETPNIPLCSTPQTTGIVQSGIKSKIIQVESRLLSLEEKTSKVLNNQQNILQYLKSISDTIHKLENPNQQMVPPNATQNVAKQKLTVTDPSFWRIKIGSFPSVITRSTLARCIENVDEDSAGNTMDGRFIIFNTVIDLCKDRCKGSSIAFVRYLFGKVFSIGQVWGRNVNGIVFNSANTVKEPLDEKIVQSIKCAVAQNFPGVSWEKESVVEINRIIRYQTKRLNEGLDLIPVIQYL